MHRRGKANLFCFSALCNLCVANEGCYITLTDMKYEVGSGRSGSDLCCHLQRSAVKFRGYEMQHISSWVVTATYSSTANIFPHFFHSLSSNTHCKGVLSFKISFRNTYNRWKLICSLSLCWSEFKAGVRCRISITSIRSPLFLEQVNELGNLELPPGSFSFLSFPTVQVVSSSSGGWT